MSRANESLKLVAFVLITVGTLGLLTNEFFVEWGRAATLASAGLNAVGLIGLAFAFMRDRRSPSE